MALETKPSTTAQPGSMSPRGHWAFDGQQWRMTDAGKSEQDQWLDTTDEGRAARFQYKTAVTQNNNAKAQNNAGSLATASKIGDTIAQAGLSAGIAAAGQNRRNDDTTAAAGQRAAADVSRQQQIRATEDAQQHRQIANRDARVEGDKDAAARAASQFQQRMAQTSGAAGGGAAALAATNVQDPSQSYQEHRQRADSQRARGEELSTQAERAAQNAVAQRTSAELLNEQASTDAARNRQATNLSQPITSNMGQGPFTVDLGNGTSVSFTRDEAMAYINAIVNGATESPKADVPELNQEVANQLKVALGTPSDKNVKHIIKAIYRRY